MNCNGRRTSPKLGAPPLWRSAFGPRRVRDRCDVLDRSDANISFYTYYTTRLAALEIMIIEKYRIQTDGHTVGFKTELVIAGR